jgi:hypothetical protein
VQANLKANVQLIICIIVTYACYDSDTYSNKYATSV